MATVWAPAAATSEESAASNAGKAPARDAKVLQRGPLPARKVESAVLPQKAALPAVSPNAGKKRAHRASYDDPLADQK